MQHLDDGRLQAWLDRERSALTQAETQAAAEHLAACPGCAARLEELEGLTHRTTALLSRHVREEAVPAYHEVVGRARALGGAGRRRGWRISAWAASVAVALGAGWMGNELYRGPASPVAPPTEPGVRAPPAEAAAGAGAGTAVADGPAAGVGAGDAQAAGATPAVPTPPPPVPVESGVAASGSTSPSPRPPSVVVDAPEDVAAAPAPAESPRTNAPAAPAEPRDPVVHGRVVDAETGQPVPAVQVYVADLDVGVLTLQDGSFRLPLFEEDVDAGALTLTVERIGYRSESRDFTAGPGDTVVLDFRITEEALMLDEVIVTGTPSGGQRRALGNAVTAAPPSVRVSSLEPSLGAGGDWSPRSPAEAGAAVGFAMASVPGLPVISVDVGRLDGVDALRVRQSLGRGATLTLLEARAPIVLDASATPDGRALSAIRRSGVSIVGAAPVPLDSLNALLERVR